jgi:hypothetical protein
MICSRCKEERQHTDFSLKKNSKSIMSLTCNSCKQKKAYLWAQNNPDKAKLSRQKYLATGKRRGKWLEANYRMSEIEFNSMLKSQEYKCAICKLDKPDGKHLSFNVDHCHKTKKVRGILCSSCNRGLGYFKDNVELLKAAINYLTVK